MNSVTEAELRSQEGRLLDAMRARDIVTLSQSFDRDYCPHQRWRQGMGPRAGAAGLQRARLYAWADRGGAGTSDSSRSHDVVHTRDLPQGNRTGDSAINALMDIARL